LRGGHRRADARPAGRGRAGSGGPVPWVRLRGGGRHAAKPAFDLPGVTMNALASAEPAWSRCAPPAAPAWHPRPRHGHSGLPVPARWARPGGGLGVDGVGPSLCASRPLARPVPLRVAGAVEPGILQDPLRSESVGAGALDTHLGDTPVAGQPPMHRTQSQTLGASPPHTSVRVCRTPVSGWPYARECGLGGRVVPRCEGGLVSTRSGPRGCVAPSCQGVRVSGNPVWAKVSYLSVRVCP
jgi:hypothetical protein